MYVRLCRTVQDVGVLLRPEEVKKHLEAIDSYWLSDWYQSAFTYGEDAKEYWEQNKGVKGFNGQVSTTSPYFDLDCKQDLNKARLAAINVCKKLSELGFAEATEIYFSGNKGFHIFVHTKTKFSRDEVQMICHNIARECQVPNDVFDTSVYNVNRIMRITDTKHQESGLYKIPISYEELENATEAEIRDAAKERRMAELETKPQDGTVLRKLYVKKIDNIVQLKTEPRDPSKPQTTETGLDLSACPPGHRKCIWTLEQGHFGPGERHNAIIRLAAYYKGQGFNRKYAETLINSALERRAEIFSTAAASSESENQRDLDQIYSADWKGGMFTCKTDAYLQSKCDRGHGPCYEEAKSKSRNVLNVSQLFNSYVEYSQQALVDYPKFGLKWLDDRVRLRPKNVTVINGANGSGKTSLAIQAIEHFNAQKMYNVFFSLDMANSSIFEKLAARYTNYSPRAIEAAFNVHTFNTEIVNEVKEVLEKALPYTLFDFTSSANMRYMEEALLGLKNSDINVQVVIVDYAGRIPGDADNQFANSTQNALMSNDVAKRTNTHMIFLSQVSRENGDHTDPLLTSRVSKDSGAWEENATTIINCWRPLGNGLMGEDKYISLYVAKNRSGPLGEMVFFWEGKRGQISEMTSKHDFVDYETACQMHEIDIRISNPFLDPQDFEDAEPPRDPRFSPKKHEGPKLKRSEETQSDEREKVSDFKPSKFRRSE